MQFVGSGVGRSLDEAYAHADSVGPVLVPYNIEPQEQTVSVVPKVVCKPFEHVGGESICAKTVSNPLHISSFSSKSSRKFVAESGVVGRHGQPAHSENWIIVQDFASTLMDLSCCQLTGSQVVVVYAT